MLLPGLTGPVLKACVVQRSRGVGGGQVLPRALPQALLHRDEARLTALEAGALAARAGVRMLALTHVSTRVQPREVRREAEREFPGVIVPRDFDQVEIPFRERGEPRLIPVQERLGKGAREDLAAADDPATLGGATL